MTHLSRPFQLVLVIFGLFAIVWLVALRGHSSSSSTSSASAPAQPATAHDSAATSNAHKPAPAAGVAHSHTSVTVHGAHGAVHASSSSTHGDTHADHATKPRAATTHSAASGSVHQGAAVAGAGAAASSSPAAHANAGAGSAASSAAQGAGATKTGAAGAPAMQVAVERELAHNKTVVILFWSPRGAEDISVRQQVPIAAKALGRSVAVHYALPHQVTEYGKITNAVQINQTPTILIVNTRGQATTLTGLTDAFAIEQAVGEARGSQ